MQHLRHLVGNDPRNTKQMFPTRIDVLLESLASVLCGRTCVGEGGRRGGLKGPKKTKFKFGSFERCPPQDNSHASFNADFEQPW